jgi:hypothetical protein
MVVRIKKSLPSENRFRSTKLETPGREGEGEMISTLAAEDNSILPAAGVGGTRARALIFSLLAIFFCWLALCSE